MFNFKIEYLASFSTDLNFEEFEGLKNRQNLVCKIMNVSLQNGMFISFLNKCQQSWSQV